MSSSLDQTEQQHGMRKGKGREGKSIHLSEEKSVIPFSFNSASREACLPSIILRCASISDSSLQISDFLFVAHLKKEKKK
jgi:hypothetical protein